jgi:hypothetical protein
MSTVGKSVYHIHNFNNIQFGNVIDEETRKGWKWLQIKWVSEPPTVTYNSSTVDIKNSWFRVDTIRVFDPQTMIESIRML